MILLSSTLWTNDCYETMVNLSFRNYWVHRERQNETWLKTKNNNNMVLVRFGWAVDYRSFFLYNMYECVALVSRECVWHWLIIMQGGHRSNCRWNRWFPRRRSLSGHVKERKSTRRANFGSCKQNKKKASLAVSLVRWVTDLWVCYVFVKFAAWCNTAPGKILTHPWHSTTGSHLRWWGLIWRRQFVAAPAATQQYNICVYVFVPLLLNFFFFISFISTSNGVSCF